MGCRETIHGVGLLVADRWIEKVLEVKTASERFLVVRVIVGKFVLTAQLDICVCPASGKANGGERGVSCYA